MRRLRLLAALATIPAAGCTDAGWSQMTAYGSNFRVTVYSGGEAVRTFHSSGKVMTEEKSDGWFFRDRESGKLVRVGGTVVIEQE